MALILFPNTFVLNGLGTRLAIALCMWSKILGHGEEVHKMDCPCGVNQSLHEVYRPTSI